MSKKSLNKEEMEYMPLKPTQYMLEDPMLTHQPHYADPESEEDHQNISKFSFRILVFYYQNHLKQIFIGLKDAFNNQNGKQEEPPKLQQLDEDM